MLELIVHRVQILHSRPVLYASLKCKLGSERSERRALRGVPA